MHLNRGATLTLNALTIVNGSSDFGGGNCAGIVTNGGNNLDSDGSCGWGSGNGSLSRIDPRLGPLADNGGSTLTMALLPDSPAVDGVTFNTPNACPATDQRGVARPIGPRCDIGAVESNIITHTFLPLIAGGAVAAQGAK